ncbi:MAG: hypothetical protein JOS17DRAFT_773424 [Linnemannia elongata]|nr:MAG: hypothetical protein JOS17DRAFT_773424 [Linnemannia elongata]
MHAFATNLLLDGSESICAICKKLCECINIPEGVSDLPQAIQPFFQPLANLCNTTLDTWKFQEQNFTKLIDHLQARAKRQNEVLVKARTELLNMKAMKSANQTLKEENERLKLRIQELQRHQSGGGGNGGQGSGAPITPVTPQIRVSCPSADRVHPSTFSSDNQRPSGREVPVVVKRAHEPQPPPQDPRVGGGDTRGDIKRLLNRDIRTQVRPFRYFQASVPSKPLDLGITLLVFLAGRIDMDINKRQFRCRG